MKTFLVRSPAKINICLNVVGKQPDGYHQLDMVILPLAMHDSMLFTEIKRGEDNFVTIDDYSMGPITYNLASSAIEKLQKLKGFSNAFRVSIHKVIPMQSGLGGGSSNAALTLVALNKYLKLNYMKLNYLKLDILFNNNNISILLFLTNTFIQFINSFFIFFFNIFSNNFHSRSQAIIIIREFFKIN